MARGRKKVSTSSLDAKIEQQKAVMEKAKLRYEAEKEALAVKVIVKVLMLVRTYMVGFDISKDTDFKSKACCTVEHKSLR